MSCSMYPLKQSDLLHIVNTPEDNNGKKWMKHLPLLQFSAALCVDLQANNLALTPKIICIASRDSAIFLYSVDRWCTTRINLDAMAVDARRQRHKWKKNFRTRSTFSCIVKISYYPQIFVQWCRQRFNGIKIPLKERHGADAMGILPIDVAKSASYVVEMAPEHGWWVQFTCKCTRAWWS